MKYLKQHQVPVSIVAAILVIISLTASAITRRGFECVIPETCDEVWDISGCTNWPDPFGCAGMCTRGSGDFPDGSKVCVKNCEEDCLQDTQEYECGQKYTSECIEIGKCTCDTTWTIVPDETQKLIDCQ